MIQRYFKLQKTSDRRKMGSIDGMLAQLRTSRQSIRKQTGFLNEIMNKSNNVLLQLETERSREITPAQDISKLKVYSYGKETKHLLSRAVELYQHLTLNEENDSDVSQSGFADYLHHNCQSLHFLSSNVRKLLVIGEIMSNVTLKSEHNECE